jgi:hypothetical protein
MNSRITNDKVSRKTNVPILSGVMRDIRKGTLKIGVVPRFDLAVKLIAMPIKNKPVINIKYLRAILDFILSNLRFIIS